MEHINNTFWQKGSFAQFRGVNNITIAYASFCHEMHTKCLVISSGRSESYLKYEELIVELFQQGFDIFILDHRGQGLSERMLKNPHKGYVKHFDDYAEDLNTFIASIVEPYCLAKQTPIYLLAHSMGSTIALRYFQLYRHPIKAAVLSSPMITFNRGILPLWLTTVIINSALFFNALVSKTPWYFIGQGNYKAKAFNDNPLTHSKSRYQKFIHLYQQKPQIQLGGVTIKWLSESLKAREAIFTHLTKLTLPIQVIQSGADKVVDNKAQNDFCQQLHQINSASCPNGKPVVINQAKHELFIEDDCYREPTIKTALNWFAQHSD